MRGGTFVVDPDELRPAAALMLGVAAVLPAVPVEGAPCPLRALTGIPCPLCGMTTSVVAAVHLDVREALSANPIGVVAVAVAFALVVARPARIRIPALAGYAALAGMWAFELYRFGVL